LDLIEVLPPGLYEMILKEKKAKDVGADLLQGQYLVRLRRRVGGRNLNAMVVGFQYLADAHRFLAELKQRLEASALELHPDKTRIMAFGRFALENRRARGQGTPGTFAFLGFTHIFGRT
jgi:hypothetical protein